ncbi:MAG: hypothetical protein ABI654_06515 [Betaproteobacteria bacterium]
MKKMNGLAVAVFAVVGFSGCTSMQVAELARAEAAPVQVPVQAAEQKVSRALPSYDNRGGYRMRRFVSVAASS